ncbi:MAG TPA: lactate utilization protein, partial [Amaricoccus sp.]|nr:lactate utilization protein [Amaricoccus sp.]
MTARDTILTAVLAACPAGDPRSVAAAAAALLDDPDSSRPPLVAPGLPEAFTLKATALGASVERVAGMASVPQ